MQIAEPHEQDVANDQRDEEREQKDDCDAERRTVGLAREIGVIEQARSAQCNEERDEECPGREKAGADVPQGRTRTATRASLRS